MINISFPPAFPLEFLIMFLSTNIDLIPSKKKNANDEKILLVDLLDRFR